MKHANTIARDILYNGFAKGQQNHLYILISDSLLQQQENYKWYQQLHVCENREGQQVCGTCPNCQRILHNNFVNSVTISRKEDKKSIGVDEVSYLQEVFSVTAHDEGVRFFCVEDADSLTIQAANSMLKFLEEPTGETVGFLFVKNEQRILPTIRSRGQIIRLLPETNSELQKEIATKVKDMHLQPAAKYLIAKGYEPKLVYKQITPFYDAISSYFTKLSNGSPFIVAQTELEKLATKTKTTTLIMDLALYLLGEELREGKQFTDAPEQTNQFLKANGAQIYVSLHNAFQLTKHHMGISMILTAYTLELETKFGSARYIRG
jgi:DNA polymerase III, gamma/tau subunits